MRVFPFFGYSLFVVIVVPPLELELLELRDLDLLRRLWALDARDSRLRDRLLRVRTTSLSRTRSAG